MAMQGIDVSSWQRGLDLARVPCDFVIAKSTEGTSYVDPCCDGFVQQAIQLGKCWGFYHYVTGGDPEAEADFWIRNTSNYFRVGIPCVDWESGGNHAWGDTDYLRRFVQRVIDKTGVRPLIYASAAAFPWDVCRELDCGAWVAQYASNNATGYQDSPWNEDAYSCVIRQYSSAGRLAGYGGNLDLDKAYITEQQWKMYANPNGQEEDMTQDEHDMLQAIYDVQHKYMGWQYAKVDDGDGVSDPVDMHQMMVDNWTAIPKLLAMEAAQTEAIKALAKMQGADPDAVAKAVSDAVEAKLKAIRLEVSTEAK